MSTITNAPAASVNGAVATIQQQQQPATTKALPPLWPNNTPNGLKIEIIGVTGEYASGKTLFGLTIDPANTLLFDTEKSAGCYENLGFTRVDLTKMANKKPIELYQAWTSAVSKIQPGKYRVIALDTVSEIESGLCDWVADNPAQFGHTKAQYDKMEGLYWGDVKEHWKRILSDLASRCETFVFTAHTTNVWSGNKPTGKRKAKGKETLMELATLYLWLERKPDSKGRVPGIPSAEVAKDRLAITTIDENGEIKVLPILPARLPEATPAAIRKYILNPADRNKPRAGETLLEKNLSADDRLLLETSKAEFERDAAQANLSRVEMMRLAGQQQMAGRAAMARIMTGETLAAAGEKAVAPVAQPTAQSATAQAPASQPAKQPASWEGDALQANTPQDNNQEPAAPSPAQELLAQAIDSGDPLLCSVAQRSTILHLRDQLKMPDNSFMGVLARRGVADVGKLTREQSQSLIETLKGMLVKN